MSEKLYDLKPIWAATLEMYCTMRKIMDANGLQHWLAFGTLLGAVRHHGFIPWDDDFDIYMPRTDYNRFVSIVKDHPPKGFAWQSYETDANYPHRFGKFRLANQSKIDDVAQASGLSLHQGIYIDVFPLDGLPESRIGRFIWCIGRSLRRHALHDFAFLKPVFGYGNDAQCNHIKYQDFFTRIPFDGAVRVGSTSPYERTSTPCRWWFKREWFSETKMVDFECISCPIPIGFHDILTGIYGDYMTLPPVGQRKPGHQIVE